MANVKAPILRAPLLLKNKGLVGWRRLSGIIASLANAYINISVDGLDIQAIDDGVHITAKPADAGALDPWHGVMSGNDVIINSGAVNGTVVPGVTLSTPAGTCYVYLHIACTLTAAYSYINSFTVDTLTLVCASSVPSDNTTGGHYYIPLIEIMDRIITVQMMSQNIGFRARGDNTQTSAAIGEYWT